MTYSVTPQPATVVGLTNPVVCNSPWSLSPKLSCLHHFPTAYQLLHLN